jgi:hypothetical protein
MLPTNKRSPKVRRARAGGAPKMRIPAPIGMSIDFVVFIKFTLIRVSLKIILA